MMALRLSTNCRQHVSSMMGHTTRTLSSHMTRAADSLISSRAGARRFRSEGAKKQTLNKKPKAKGGGDFFAGGDTASRDKHTDIALRGLNATKRKPPKADEAEMARRAEIGRQYVIGRFNQHNDLHHDLACKIAMKQHAIKMLPRNSYIREEALRTDYFNDISPGNPIEPPFDRIIPDMYPPMPKSAAD